MGFPEVASGAAKAEPRAVLVAIVFENGRYWNGLFCCCSCLALFCRIDRLMDTEAGGDQAEEVATRAAKEANLRFMSAGVVS